MKEKLELIASIYDAALNPALWQQVTAQIARYCDGEKIMLATTDTLHPHSNFQHTYNIPQEQITAWREGLDAEEVELHNRWGASVPTGTPISSDDYFGGPEQFLAAGGAFVKMLNSIDIRRQMVMFFDRDHFRLSGIGLNNFHPFAPYAAERLAELSPHLRRSLEIHHQIRSLQNENRNLYQLLEAMHSGVVLIDSQSRIRYTTAKARELLIEQGNFIVKNGLLCAQDSDIHARLHDLIHNAIQISLRDGGQPNHLSMAIRSKNNSQLLVSVAPLSALEHCHSLQSDNIAAAIFISNNKSSIELPSRALVELYHLTPREVQVCESFVNLADLNKVALHLQLKISSVRSLIKSIYYKTGQSSQAELMRLLVASQLNFRHF